MESSISNMKENVDSPDAAKLEVPTIRLLHQKIQSLFIQSPLLCISHQLFCIKKALSIKLPRQTDYIDVLFS